MGELGNLKNIPWFGWILKDNPNFWENNGYEKIDSSNFHYYGCVIAKENRLPVYSKHLYICHDTEDDSMVEVFPCDIGGMNSSYIVAIHTWNNAGGTKFSLDIAMQVCTIDTFNALIMEYIGEKVEDGTYLLKR